MNPPRLAVFLVQRFASDVVAGDLIEIYRSGTRSRWWLWRQVVGSIAAEMSRDVREHPVLTVRAVVLGLSFTWLVLRYVMLDLLHYDEWLFVRGVMRWVYLNGYGLPEWSVWPATALILGASGWIVGRTHRQLRASVVLTYAISIQCVVLGMGVWEITHPVDAMWNVVVRQALLVTCAVAALVGGVVGFHTTSLSEQTTSIRKP